MVGRDDDGCKQIWTGKVVMCICSTSLGCYHVHAYVGNIMASRGAQIAKKVHLPLSSMSMAVYCIKVISVHNSSGH